MKVKWKVLGTQLTIWLMTEVVLNCLGLDTFADYSEFINNRQRQAQANLPVAQLILPNREVTKNLNYN